MTSKLEGENFKISMNQISMWGMYKQVKVEQLVDFHLQKIKEPSKAQLKIIIEKWCKSKKINNQEYLNQWKINNGLNEDQWNQFVTRKWKWSKWCLANFKNKVPNYYLEKKAKLDMVTYSLIRVKNKNLANELYLRITEEESTFEEIAQQYSEGPERNTLGNVGPIEIGKAHPDLCKLLQVSQNGQIWSPKKMESWWVIVKLKSLQSIPLDESLFTKLALELGKNYLETTVSSTFKETTKNLNQ